MGFLVWLIETIGWNAFKAWWQRDKTQEAVNAENDVSSLSNSELDRRVQSEITRKQ